MRETSLYEGRERLCRLHRGGQDKMKDGTKILCGGTSLCGGRVSGHTGTFYTDFQWDEISVCEL